MRPEHTIEAYKLAIKQNADIIECDIAVTKVSFKIFQFFILISIKYFRI